jgi:hypothetical protein
MEEVQAAVARGERDSADLGPYDSSENNRTPSIQNAKRIVEPATRPSTVIEAAPPPQARTPIHPFARTTGPTIPFAALADKTAADMGTIEYIVDQGRGRPESEVLSRGAGVRVLDRPKDAVPGGRFVGVGMDGSPGTNDSLGMGTFGQGGSQVPQPIVSCRILGELPADMT